jgi:hypothetical protein
MINLDDRALMALEIFKSMLESPFYFDVASQRNGVVLEAAAREAVAAADALRKCLGSQSAGSVTLLDDKGDVVALSPEGVVEATRLAQAGDKAEAIKLIKSSCNASQKSASEYVEKLISQDPA